MTLRRRHLIAAAAATTALPGAALAQAWPTKPVTLVVPFTAGSGTDTMARLFGERLAAATGQTVIVDNKPGANGTIAGNAVARAAPDGHTLFYTTNTTHAANASLLKSVPYDPVADFAPVGLIGIVPFILVAHPSAPFSNARELFAHAKANPGKLSYGAGNSTAHVSGESIKRIAGIDVLHVPYKSAPPALQDTIAGTVHFTFIDLLTGLPHVRGGRLKAIASTSSQRSPNLPDLPTLREQGIEFELDAWYALFAPAKTPVPVVDRLNKLLHEIYGAPEMSKRMADNHVILRLGLSAELAAFQKLETEKWTRLVRAAGIQPEG